MGILALYEALARVADVIVVAPDRNRSGAGSALTLDRPLSVTEQPNGFLAVDGTPADCVMLAITDLLDEDPDMVVSGINNGANLGDDVLYSGTVGAAYEGRVLGACSIAVSLARAHDSKPGQALEHFATAAEVIVNLLAALSKSPLPASMILNVNVPDLTADEIKGWRVTRLGSRGRSASATKGKGRESIHPLFRIGPAGDAVDDGPGTDFYAVSENYVSITPLKVDRTASEEITLLNTWLGETTFTL